MFCESCHENPATVFVTQVLNEETKQIRLCESCARARAENQGETSIEGIVFGLFDEMKNHRADNENGNQNGNQNGESNDENGFSISELFMEMQQDDDFDDELELFLSDENFGDDLNDSDDLESLDDDDFDNLSDDSDDDSNGIFADVFDNLEGIEKDGTDVFPSLSELMKSGPFAEALERRDVQARRCPKCSITWDRLRQDGRAGCSGCYEAFAEQLHEVMRRVQHAPQHHGKKPRAAEKRHNRLEHLRAQRDHRLEMLNRRLEEAVRDEKYKEAAKLRDQIKTVESTIVQEN